MSHNIGAEGVSRDTPPSHRTRHQISRSISEFSSPIRLHRHQSNTRAVKDQRERDSLTALSPTPQGRLSLDGSRSDGITSNYSPDPSRNASRRTSILMASGDDAPAGAPGVINVNGVGSGAATKASVEDVLALERKRAVARESGLKKSLAELEDFTARTTTHLEDIYESMGEKLSAMQSMVIAMKEIAGLSDQMNQTFNADAEELITDISSQLDAFGQFEDQQKRIEKLQGRIQTGRDKIRVLSKRVDVVMERIENWERADREWQERTRRRLKVVWVVTSIVLFSLLFLFLGAQYGYAPEGLEVRNSGPDAVSVDGMAAGNMLSAIPNAENSGSRDLFPNGSSTEGTAAFTPDALRFLDEL